MPRLLGVGIGVFSLFAAIVVGFFVYAFFGCTVVTTDGTRIVRPSTMRATYSASIAANSNGHVTCTRPDASGASTCNKVWLGEHKGQHLGQWGEGQPHAWVRPYISPVGFSNGVTFYAASPPLTLTNLVSCAIGNIRLALTGGVPASS